MILNQSMYNTCSYLSSATNSTNIQSIEFSERPLKRKLGARGTGTKAHCISTLGYNLCRLENTKRTSEVETHPSSLWSHRERWRGLASFCDSSGHASCKREEGIREGESEEDYDKQTSISSHSMSSPIKQVEELYVLCIQHFKSVVQHSRTEPCCLKAF